MIRTLYPIIMLMMLIRVSTAQEIDLRRISHPHSPNDKAHIDKAYLEPELLIKSSVKDLKAQKNWLVEQLKRFPKPTNANFYRQDKYGTIFPINEEGTSFELKLDLKENILCEGIALVPALFLEHSSTQNYAFPKRFKIEGFKINTPNTPITIADWTTEDFPDPGLGPVIFTTAKRYFYKLKVTVYKGLKEKGKHFFALDEMLIFRHGLNIAPLIVRRLKTTNVSNYAPHWHLKYLMDGNMHLGPPLGANIDTSQTKENDFTLFYSSEMNSEKGDLITSLTIDLGKQRSISRVEFHSAYNASYPLPNLPLPHSYSIELMKGMDPEIITKVIKTRDVQQNKVRHHSLYSHTGRYLRCTFTKLPVINNHPVLALGEIRIVGDNGVNQGLLELNKEVILNSTHPDYILKIPSTASLVDGLSNEKPIKAEKLFIEQLAKRSLVTKVQEEVNSKLISAIATRSKNYWIIGISLAALFAIIVALSFNKMGQQKRQEIRSIQRQISADLHDDISGNLGTIAMISNRIHKLTNVPKVKEKLREIEHLSKESYLSVKEIIWHADSESITFSELIKRIQRTAESVSNDCKISYNMPNNSNEHMNLTVPVSMRRNIILLVKESLFNCAKYAKADHILITTDINSSDFTLILKDNGCGFDLSPGVHTSSLSGKGLLNMEQRAKLLGADLSINSQIGLGTEIKLIMPLDQI